MKRAVPTAQFAWHVEVEIVPMPVQPARTTSDMPRGVARRDVGTSRAERLGLGVVALLIGFLAACSADTGGSADTVVLACGVETDRAELRNMETLNLRGCGDIDFRPLWEAENLHTLRIFDPALEDIRMIAPLRSLEDIRFEKSRVVDLTPIGPIDGLRVLHVVDTPLASIEPLARLESLEKLDISDSYVTDLLPLSGHPALHTLRAPRARISDLSVLSTLPALTTVDLSENGISDLSPLLDHPNIAALTLNLRGNCIVVDDPSVEVLVETLNQSAAGLYLGTQVPPEECESEYFGDD